MLSIPAYRTRNGITGLKFSISALSRVETPLTAFQQYARGGNLLKTICHLVTSFKIKVNAIVTNCTG